MDYESYLQNPNVRRFLQLIGIVEGADYNVGYGGRRINNLASFPYNRCAFNRDGSVNTSGRCSRNTTSAAGKYQFQFDTWNNIKRVLGLSDFSPRSQDIGAIYLLQRRGALSDVVRGDYQNAIIKSMPEWEGFVSKGLQGSLRLLNSIGSPLGSSPGSGLPSQSYSTVPDSLVYNAKDSVNNFNQFLGKKVVTDRQRYLFAFAILVVIFIFVLS